jgi:methyl-accepting chemotaxis protein
MNFTKLKIGARLGTGFGVVLILLLFVASIGMWRLFSVGELTDRIVKRSLVKERLITEWKNETMVNGVRTIAIINTDEASELARLRTKIAETSKHISELQKQWDAMEKNETEIKLYADVAHAREMYVKARDAVFLEQKEGSFEKASQMGNEVLQPALDTYAHSLKALSDQQGMQIHDLSTEVESQYHLGKMLMSGLGALALLLGITFAIWITRSITRPLSRAVVVANAIAGGDLTSRIEIESRDEVGLLLEAFSDMNQSLVKIVHEVRGGTDTIAAASSQIVTGNLDLSARTEQQASSLEETASSMEELIGTVKQNVDNARQANQQALSASDIAVKGGTIVAEVVRTMGSINDSSKKIADIISVIDSIAFQTNILALNAAVEAARAGEQGRGFAVVATEVRNLAQRSAAAAKEIKELISDSVDKVATGGKLVDQAGATMHEIVASIKRVTDAMGEITTASQEQQAGIEQVNQAIVQMDQATQQNATLVEEAAAAVASLHDQADTLTKVVSVFKLDAARSASIMPMKAKTALPMMPKKDTPTIKSARPKQVGARKIANAASGTPSSNADDWV